MTELRILKKYFGVLAREEGEMEMSARIQTEIILQQLIKGEWRNVEVVLDVESKCRADDFVRSFERVNHHD